MPDWFIRRNSEDSPYPYHVRLGGCEYSLSEEEFKELAMAFYSVRCGTIAYVESEEYQDICHSHATKSEQLQGLLKLIGIKDEEPTDRMGL